MGTQSTWGHREKIILQNNSKSFAKEKFKK